ncbi:MAG: aminopeptidase, partial [Bacteroidetes bacterium]|nr:aminopeptidase [Bacteroidota bacterium]
MRSLIITILVIAVSISIARKPLQFNDNEEEGPRDVHSFAKTDEAIVKHLELDINVDLIGKKISGTASWKIKNIKGVERIFFDTRRLNIHKITIGEEGTETSYRLSEEDKHLGQSLEVVIKPNTEWVHINYSTNADAAALQWLDAQQTADKRLPFLFTQSQAILARSWIPCQDGPGIRFTYNAKVQVPKGLFAVMSAENPTRRTPEGIYNFVMKQPVPSYLMALAVGDFVFKPIGPRTGVYAEPSM